MKELQELQANAGSGKNAGTVTANAAARRRSTTRGCRGSGSSARAATQGPKFPSHIKGGEFLDTLTFSELYLPTNTQSWTGKGAQADIAHCVEWMAKQVNAHMGDANQRACKLYALFPRFFYTNLPPSNKEQVPELAERVSLFCDGNWQELMKRTPLPAPSTPTSTVDVQRLHHKAMTLLRKDDVSKAMKTIERAQAGLMSTLSPDATVEALAAKHPAPLGAIDDANLRSDDVLDDKGMEKLEGAIEKAMAALPKHRAQDAFGYGRMHLEVCLTGPDRPYSGGPTGLGHNVAMT